MSTFKTLFMGVGFAAIATLSACSSSSNASLTQSGLNPADFDSTVLGKKTELVTLKNASGMEVCLTNYGGRVVSFPFQTRTESQQMWFLVTIISISMLTPLTLLQIMVLL